MSATDPEPAAILASAECGSILRDGLLPPLDASRMERMLVQSVSFSVILQPELNDLARRT